MPKFVLIIGPQAVGKMTVGQELAKQTGYKLFHNHMTIELVRDIFNYDKKAYSKMNRDIRDLILKEFSNSHQPGIIFTYCFDFKEYQEEKEITDYWMSLFEESYVVELEADVEERLKRNKTENRLQHKQSKRDLEWSEKDLLKSLTKHQLNSDVGQGEKLFNNYLRINNTNLSPEEVANKIQEKFQL